MGYQTQTQNIYWRVGSNQSVLYLKIKIEINLFKNMHSIWHIKDGCFGR